MQWTLRVVAAGVIAACGFAAPVAGGQTVASASVSGIVSDPSGVLPGATVRLKNLETNEVREAAADERGRYRLLYVPVGRYELTATAPGFAPASVPLTLTVGQTRDVPLRADGGGGDGIGADHPACAAGRDHADPVVRHDRAAGNRLAAAQRAQLSRPRAARAERHAHQHAIGRAVCRDLGRARHRHHRRRSAQHRQHLHRRRSVGERRCRGSGRDLLRPGSDPRVPGDHLRRCGRVRTRLRRHDQHRHAVGHERRPWPAVWVLPRRCAGCPERAGDCRRPAVTAAVRNDARRAARRRIARSGSPTSSARSRTRPDS